jgi:hypothetical protein
MSEILAFDEESIELVTRFTDEDWIGFMKHLSTALDNASVDVTVWMDVSEEGETFDDFRGRDEILSCHTPGCICGHAVLYHSIIYPGEITGFAVDGALVEVGSGRHLMTYSALGKHILGLNSLSIGLFYAPWYSFSSVYRRWPEEIYRLYERDNKAGVFAAIKHFTGRMLNKPEGRS